MSTTVCVCHVSMHMGTLRPRFIETGSCTYLHTAPFHGLIKIFHSESSSLGMMHELSSYLQKSG